MFGEYGYTSINGTLRGKYPSNYEAIGYNFSNWERQHMTVGNEPFSIKGNRVVADIDAAIAKGTIDRNLTLYRAAAYPELDQVWQRFNISSPAEDIFITDSAFVLTTLGSDIAHWWNRTQLNNKGIVLEIVTPAGSHAAYLDAENVFPNRGYLELVLGRNSRFKVLQAYTDSQGRKILKVEYISEPFS